MREGKTNDAGRRRRDRTCLFFFEDAIEEHSVVVDGDDCMTADM